MPKTTTISETTYQKMKLPSPVRFVRKDGSIDTNAAVKAYAAAAGLPMEKARDDLIWLAYKRKETLSRFSRENPYKPAKSKTRKAAKPKARKAAKPKVRKTVEPVAAPSPAPTT
jgi:hypothetical protein